MTWACSVSPRGNSFSDIYLVQALKISCCCIDCIVISHFTLSRDHLPSAGSLPRAGEAYEREMGRQAEAGTGDLKGEGSSQPRSEELLTSAAGSAAAPLSSHWLNRDHEPQNTPNDVPEVNRLDFWHCVSLKLVTEQLKPWAN